MYECPVIDKYLKLLKSNVPDVRGWFNGFISTVPASMLPCIMVQTEKIEADEMSNMEDEHRIFLVLTFIADIRQTVDDRMITSLNKVLDVLAGRNADYSLKTTSILYVLRHNLNIDTANNLRTDIKSFTVVTPTEIASGRFAGLFTAEGSVRFQANYFQER